MIYINYIYVIYEWKNKKANVDHEMSLDYRLNS